MCNPIPRATATEALCGGRAARRATIRTLGCAATLVLAALPAAVARPARAAESSDEESVRKARAAYTLRDYELARGHFEDAYRISGRPDLLRNIAFCHEGLGNWEQAVFFYERYLHERPDAVDAAEVRVRMERAASRAGVPAPEAAPRPGA